MSFYDAHVFPRLLSWVSHHFDDDRWRVLSQARGRVLELGVGTGASFGFYGDEVDEVVGIDPHSRVLDRALVDEEDREWCTDYCLTATRENRNHAFIYRARTADGRALWLKDVVRVITDGAGRPVLLRGVMVDVTREHPESAPQRERELE